MSRTTPKRQHVRRLRPPLEKIIGDLSNRERVLVGLDMRLDR